MSGSTLREVIAEGGLRDHAVPGVFDALSARLADRAGFPVLFLSGAAVNYTRFGRPDLGFAGLPDIEDITRRITARVSARLIVDADTGFGGPVQVADTVMRLEAAGAAAIQIEDQLFPKRCGHLPGKTLVDPAEMVAKIEIARDARRKPGTMIIARTDAITVNGIDDALERASVYLDAGADALFVEAPGSRIELVRIAEAFADRAPLVANMVDGGKTPLQSRKDLAEMGYDIVLAPGAPARAAVQALEAFYGGLHRSGDLRDLLPMLAGFKELNEILGLENELSRLGETSAPNGDQQAKT